MPILHRYSRYYPDISHIPAILSKPLGINNVQASLNVYHLSLLQFPYQALKILESHLVSQIANIFGVDWQFGAQCWQVGAPVRRHSAYLLRRNLRKEFVTGKFFSLMYHALSVSCH